MPLLGLARDRTSPPMPGKDWLRCVGLGAVLLYASEPPSYIKRTSMQLYQYRTGPVTGPFGGGTGRALQEIVGDTKKLLRFDGVLWE